ncbi:hypothetical protein DXA09_11175 [Absiella sp. AM54-8XD]|nr:hypothetical protein DW271_14460 [Absiella sp. AM22-9]RGB58928.1 hypothetical protein DW120_12760 [Absiella sp. AM10-20]RGB62126.1 hypothetical protein DW113_19850 [Absiella sp. AM09-45]RGB71582.1 hypothetical protein DW114_19920 [Absiella sp. AM09-50]RGC21454.1 hypothetical protein DXA09_11175 [Absiella sp. AM54-8XD]RGC44032.1 hypothetical protein DW761_20260 [Absiella sp. AM29-15]RHU10464.1 hypothetical protein DW716_00125 [Absiella sp. AM27-20]
MLFQQLKQGMLNISSASLKTQALLALCLLIGYFSPLAGIIIAGILTMRKADKRYTCFLLLGGVLALFLFVLNYCFAYL